MEMEMEMEMENSFVLRYFNVFVTLLGVALICLHAAIFGEGEGLMVGGLILIMLGGVTAIVKIVVLADQR